MILSCRFFCYEAALIIRYEWSEWLSVLAPSRRRILQKIAQLLGSRRTRESVCECFRSISKSKHVLKKQVSFLHWARLCFAAGPRQKFETILLTKWCNGIVRYFRSRRTIVRSTDEMLRRRRRGLGESRERGLFGTFLDLFFLGFPRISSGNFDLDYVSNSSEVVK